LASKGPLTVAEIKNLQPGLQFWGKYLISEKVSRKTREGKNITNLKLCDKTGEIRAVVWDSCQLAGALELGKVIGLLGDVGSYNQQLQITAKRIKVLDEEPDNYMKGPEKSVNVLQHELQQIIDSVQDIHMHNLLTEVFTPVLWSKFLASPAAKAVHHNYSGGLIEHTLKVAQLGDKISSLYKDINRDLLITGAILHDIGKIQEFSIEILPDYTEVGRMVGHIVLGYELVAKAIGKIREEGNDFPEQLEYMLKNMLLSHHGSLEFGSPVLPLFPEALMLHVLDDLDAKMFVFFNKIEENHLGETSFTAYDTFFQQQFYTRRYISSGNNEN
jgi:3'-5' exoribonuclease